MQRAPLGSSTLLTCLTDGRNMRCIRPETVLGRRPDMKYVITWTPRAGGSALDNEASSFRFLELMRNWTPSPDSTFHQFVLRVDGDGGFAIVESNNESTVASTLYKFSPHFRYTVYPVVDFEEGRRIADEAEAFHKSIK
ncbi:MAG TPA: DUF3303 family protein [Streptosporangiaceae bacterium]|nr:DUF3303 family protein [Streptosporangiaceae bacterium]